MQEIYVETWGNDDTGDGSKSNPYLTLYKALSMTSGNESTIYLGKGKFVDEHSMLQLSQLIKLTRTINIVGKQDKTVLDIKKASDHGGYGKYSNYPTFIFKNIVFDIGGDNLYQGTDCAYIIYNTNSSRPAYTFYNCVFIASTIHGSMIVSVPGTYDNVINCLACNNINFGIDMKNYGYVYLYNCASTKKTSNAYEVLEAECVFDAEYNPKTYRLTNASNSKYGVYSGEYAWDDGYLLFMNNKYYSILPAHYVDGTYQEVDLATVKADEDASDNYLFSPSALFEDLTIGEGESAITFKPIEKFDNFQLVDVAAEELPYPLTISGLKVNNAMISMIVPVSMKKYNVIHSVTATYEGTVRLAFSFDKGTTWKTFNTTDGVWEDLFIDIALKDYASYTVNDKTNWNKAKAKILTDGIDPADLEITDLINFNINAKTMLVAAAMERNDYNTPASFSGLTILYDSPNTYERVESTQCKVAITGDTIEVTPTFASNELLITAVTNL